MRNLVCLSIAAALAVPVLAHGQDFTPTGDRILSDPTYLPLKGQVYGQTDYGYSQTNGHLFDPTGAETAGIRNTLNIFDQKLAYGITDALSVRAGFSYGFGTDRRATPTDTTSNNRNGLENPTIGATYRVLDQRSHPISFDVFGDYAPDVFPSKSASLSQDGTVATGGPEADFGFAVGRETRMFTIQGAFTDRYVGGTSTFNRTSGLSNTAPSFWVPVLGVQTQTRFTPRLSANLGYAYNFQSRSVAVQPVNGPSYTNQIGDTQTVNVSLNYHLIPNRLVGSVGYQHTFYGNRNQIYADPTSDLLQTRTGDAMNVSLRYLFR